MKFLVLFTIFLLSVSCAHKEVKTVHENIEKYEYKSTNQLEKDIDLLITHHPEFNDDQKEKIRSVLNTALKQNRQLKLKESQMTQHLLELTLANKASYTEIANLRKAMTLNYNQKAKLFEQTALKLKKIIGITLPQNDFEKETSLLFLRQNFK